MKSGLNLTDKDFLYFFRTKTYSFNFWVAFHSGAYSVLFTIDEDQLVDFIHIYNSKQNKIFQMEKYAHRRNVISGSVIL